MIHVHKTQVVNNCGCCAECRQVADVRAVGARSNRTAAQLPLQEPGLRDAGVETTTRTRHGTAQHHPSQTPARVSFAQTTRSHPEMVGDMSARVTLNFDLSKVPFVRF